MPKKEDVLRDLTPNGIKKYGQHFEILILTITETMNPYSRYPNKETLFNIGAGKAASEEATSFLLYVTDIGNRACDEFIKECKSNLRRFEERVKKQKIHMLQKKVLILN